MTCLINKLSTLNGANSRNETSTKTEKLSSDQRENFIFVFFAEKINVLHILKCNVSFISLVNMNWVLIFLIS